MANPYDKARELVLAIKESQEYKEYLETKGRASLDPELVSALNDYQEKQFEMQKLMLMGDDAGAAMLEQMQSLYAVLARDPAAAAYLQAQMRFMILVNDVYQVLGEVVKA